MPLQQRWATGLLFVPVKKDPQTETSNQRPMDQAVALGQGFPTNFGVCTT